MKYILTFVFECERDTILKKNYEINEVSYGCLYFPILINIEIVSQKVTRMMCNLRKKTNWKTIIKNCNHIWNRDFKKHCSRLAIVQSIIVHSLLTSVSIKRAFYQHLVKTNEMCFCSCLSVRIDGKITKICNQVDRSGLAMPGYLPKRETGRQAKLVNGWLLKTAEGDKEWAEVVCRC